MKYEIEYNDDIIVKKEIFIDKTMLFQQNILELNIKFIKYIEITEKLRNSWINDYLQLLNLFVDIIIINITI